MKKIAAFVLVLLMLFPTLAHAAEKNVDVFLDGKKMKFSNGILEESGTTLVPFRNLFEALGAVISFDPKTSTVKAVKGSTTVQLVLGQTVAFKNGEPIKLNVPAKSVKNVTYVPLRFVGQSFGYNISLKNKNIYLTSPAPVEPTTPTTPTDLEPTAPTDSTSTTPTTPTAPTTTTDGVLTIEQIGKYADRVVYIEVSDSKGRVTASGSGVIVSADGEIITNYHVIDGAASAKIYLDDKRTFTTTTLLNANEDRDLALLKIDATGLPYVTIGDSAKLKLGESVVAIGSPLGFTNSLTAGLVSTPSRIIDGHDFIQISAPIDHGSSGGALFNMKGELVGITSAKIESSANINLAIPSKDVQSFLSAPRTSTQMQGQSTAVAPDASPDASSQTGGLTTDELEEYLNDNYGELSFQDNDMHFEWKVYLSEEEDHFLVAGTMTDGKEWVTLMEAQDADDTVIPSLLYYMSEELHNDLKLSDVLFSLFLNVYFDEYPSSLPSEYIISDGSGYRFVYNFAYGQMDYANGYLYYNLTPEDDDAIERIDMN